MKQDKFFTKKVSEINKVVIYDDLTTQLQYCFIDFSTFLGINELTFDKSAETESLEIKCFTREAISDMVLSTKLMTWENIFNKWGPFIPKDSYFYMIIHELVFSTYEPPSPPYPEEPRIIYKGRLTARLQTLVEVERRTPYVIVKGDLYEWFLCLERCIPPPEVPGEFYLAIFEDASPPKLYDFDTFLSTQEKLDAPLLSGNVEIHLTILERVGGIDEIEFKSYMLSFEKLFSSASEDFEAARFYLNTYENVDNTVGIAPEQFYLKILEYVSTWQFQETDHGTYMCIREVLKQAIQIAFDTYISTYEVLKTAVETEFNTYTITSESVSKTVVAPFETYFMAIENIESHEGEIPFQTYLSIFESVRGPQLIDFMSYLIAKEEVENHA